MIVSCRFVSERVSLKLIEKKQVSLSNKFNSEIGSYKL